MISILWEPIFSFPGYYNCNEFLILLKSRNGDNRMFFFAFLTRVNLLQKNIVLNIFPLLVSISSMNLNRLECNEIVLIQA